MHEQQEPQYFERYSIDHETRKEQLLGSIVEVAQKQGVEIEIEAAMYRAFLDLYSSSPELEELVDTFVRVRTDMSPTHHRYMIRSALQLVAIRKSAVYPAGFENNSAWYGVMQTLLDDQDLKQEITDNLRNLHLKTNIPDRYKPIAILAHWMRANGRLGDRVSVIDFGCSRNLGLKALAFMENTALLKYAFDKTVVVEPVGHDDITYAEYRRPNGRLSAVVRQLQNTPFGLYKGHGLDLEDPTDPKIKEWTMANLTPRDYQTGRADLLEVLDEAYNSDDHRVHPKITFQRQDIVLRPQPNSHEETLSDAIGQFDIGTLVTSLNQMSEDQRYLALRRARQQLKPTGLLVVQEFARVDEDLPTELELLDDQWNKKFSYRTIILDMMRPYGYQEVMRWNGGRPKEVNIPTINGSEPEIMPASGHEAVGLRTYLGQLALDP